MQPFIFLNYSENLLRDLPPTQKSDYVIREQFHNIICNQLKHIDQRGGQILVHGMPGSGKTIAVCQAIRQVIIQENCFKPYGCYWIKIGIHNQFATFLISYANIIIQMCILP